MHNKFSNRQEQREFYYRINLLLIHFKENILKYRTKLKQACIINLQNWIQLFRIFREYLKKFKTIGQNVENFKKL